MHAHSLTNSLSFSRTAHMWELIKGEKWKRLVFISKKKFSGSTLIKTVISRYFVMEAYFGIVPLLHSFAVEGILEVILNGGR